jgi:predicted transcriptional regulator
LTTDVPHAPDQTGLLTLTAAIVSAYVARNPLPAIELPGLIRTTYDALSTLGQVTASPASEPVPAVPIKKSVFPDHIICLEDGRSFKSLKRHLRTAYGMTPEDYRARWKLPADYPMVAPDYAAHRASLARAIGLGRKISAHTVQEEAELPNVTPAEDLLPAEPTITRLPERRRGRRPKSA